MPSRRPRADGAGTAAPLVPEDHQKPSAGEVRACLPWLAAELRVIRPRAVVCLGPTAARALLGKGFRVTRRRGEILRTPLAPRVMATVHPSSILRAPDDETRRAGAGAARRGSATAGGRAALRPAGAGPAGLAPA